MTRNEYIQYQIKTIKDNWFTDHKATLFEYGEGKNKIQHLIWKKPGTTINSIEYLTNNGALIVHGDLGEQIYNFYRPIDIRGFTDFDDFYSYVIGKAHNIDGYCKLYDWETKYTKEWYTDYFDDWNEDEKPFDIDDILWYNGSEHELTQFFYDQIGNDVDYEDISSMVNVLKAPHWRALSHFIGLEMANKQLKENENN